MDVSHEDIEFGPDPGYDPDNVQEPTETLQTVAIHRRDHGPSTGAPMGQEADPLAGEQPVVERADGSLGVDWLGPLVLPGVDRVERSAGRVTTDPVPQLVEDDLSNGRARQPRDEDDLVGKRLLREATGEEPAEFGPGGPGGAGRARRP